MPHKRQRSSSSSSSASSSASVDSATSAPPATAHKAVRLPPSSISNSPFSCSLAPTCARTPVSFDTPAAAAAHYRRVHELVCLSPAPSRKGKERDVVGPGGDGTGSEGVCGCVFPEARLLQLHQNEFHDPLLAIQQDQGKKIYDCYLPPEQCDKKFSTVKGRRLHLIAAHHFPEQYFFAVVKHGIGPLLERQGMGASLLRPTFDPASMPSRPPIVSQHPLSSLPRAPPPPPAFPAASASPAAPSRARDPAPHLASSLSSLSITSDAGAVDDVIDPLASLSASMSSLAFVPRAVSLAGKKQKKPGAAAAMSID